MPFLDSKLGFLIASAVVSSIAVPVVNSYVQAHIRDREREVQLYEYRLQNSDKAQRDALLEIGQITVNFRNAQRKLRTAQSRFQHWKKTGFGRERYKRAVEEARDLFSTADASYEAWIRRTAAQRNELALVFGKPVAMKFQNSAENGLRIDPCGVGAPWHPDRYHPSLRYYFGVSNRYDQPVTEVAAREAAAAAESEPAGQPAPDGPRCREEILNESIGLTRVEDGIGGPLLQKTYVPRSVHHSVRLVRNVTLKFLECHETLVDTYGDEVRWQDGFSNPETCPLTRNLMYAMSRRYNFLTKQNDEFAELILVSLDDLYSRDTNPIWGR